jgi:hypothetical protein
VAFVALLFALGGTGLAVAFSVPVNSVGTKQLKNNAVTSEKIQDGAVTKAKINTSGLTVPNATNAKQLGGVAARDYQESTLPSGRTETGIFNWSGYSTSGSYVSDAIQFSPPLAADLNTSHAKYQSVGTTSTQCPGVGRAARGWLCLYEGRNDGGDTFYSAKGDPQGTGSAIRSYGTIAYWMITASGATIIRGTWAVTAP